MRFTALCPWLVLALLAGTGTGPSPGTAGHLEVAASPAGAPAGSGVSVRSVAAGGYAGYAVLSNGRVWAWGDDLEGQIGDAGPWSSLTLPVEVKGLSDVTSVAGGGNSAYALRGNGTVWAWGDNSQGELGDGRFTARPLPGPVHSPRPVGLIAAGAFSVFAVGRDAKAWAWGDNSFGQLGTGSAQVGSTAPHEVARIENVAAVAAGSADGYALLSDRTVWAWGDNSLGQLGGGACRLTAAGPRSTCLGSAVPDEVPGLRGVVAIAAGGDSGYALRRDGSVWAWGDDGYGELGNALVRLDEDVPVRVVGLTHVIAIAAGSCSGYALLTNGTVWSWGRGDYGQLGDGATSDRSVPVQVKDLTNVVQVVGGGDMAFALLSNGELWAWGANAYGQLGDGSVTDHDLPVRVLGLPGPPP